MSDISRVALFGKLNAVGYQAIESATVFCKLRGNPYVELEHWLAQLLQLPDSDLHRVIRHAGLDQSVVASDLTRALDRLPRGAASISDLAEPIVNAVERAWVYATLKYGDHQVRTGHLLVAMLKSHNLRNALVGISRQFDRIDAERLADDLMTIVSGSPEDGQRATDGSFSGEPGEASAAMAPAQMGKQEALKRFAVDLTERARRGELDPVRGREEEMRQIVDILMRRRQNNPILTGEAGVGKTAVVEGFAAADRRRRCAAAAARSHADDARHRPAAGGRQHEGRVRKPPAAGDRRSAVLAQADHSVHRRGAHADRRRRRGRHRGCRQPAQARARPRQAAHDRRDHLGRIQEVLREGPGADPPLPGGAGARAERGQGDPDGCAAWPRRWRSTIACSCSTRRIEAAVRLSHRYIPARQLPDKAVSLLDTPARGSRSPSTPRRPEVEDAQRRIEGLQTELDILGRERRSASTSQSDARTADKAMAAERERLAGLEARWQHEKELVDPILELRGKLRAGGKAVDETSKPMEARPRRLPFAGHRGQAAAEAAKLRRAAAPEAPTAEQRAQWLAELKRAAGAARRDAGRKAADPADASMRRRSPRWSPTGPAFRSAGWSRTKSRRCCISPTR